MVPDVVPVGDVSAKAPIPVPDCDITFKEKYKTPFIYLRKSPAKYKIFGVGYFQENDNKSGNLMNRVRMRIDK